MDGEAILSVLDEAAAAVGAALGQLDDWGLADTRPGQYLSDVAADRAALSVLLGAGFGVLSEETGLHEPEREIIVVVDPVDGSTNASRGIPWYATSLCALDPVGPCAALVVNQATGERFDAIRGAGSRRDGAALAGGSCREMADATVGLSGWPSLNLGWSQMRALGAAALDLCAVACGRLDAYVDCSQDGHGPWDYLGALLVCSEAGVVAADAFGRDLIVLDHAARRTPVAAATAELLATVRTRRRALG